NYATANINIKKDYLYSPINMDLYSVKDEYSINKFNLLPFGKDLEQSDLEKFSSASMKELSILKSGKYGNILAGKIGEGYTQLGFSIQYVYKELKENTEYIYSVEIANPNNDIIQDESGPVYAHWYDDNKNDAVSSNELINVEK